MPARTPSEQSAPDSATWKDFTDPSGRHFRLNLKTGVAQWDVDHPQKQMTTATQQRARAAVAPTTRAPLPSQPAPANHAGAPTEAQAASKHAVPEAKLEVQPEAASETRSEAKSEEGTNWFAVHGWLDDWLGWGESVADPASQEVREDVAQDLGLRTESPTSIATKMPESEVVPRVATTNAPTSVRRVIPAPALRTESDTSVPTKMPESEVVPRVATTNAPISVRRVTPAPAEAHAPAKPPAKAPAQKAPATAQAVAEGREAVAELYKQAAEHLPVALPSRPQVTAPAMLVPRKVAVDAERPLAIS